jgi:hypothetical protein
VAEEFMRKYGLSPQVYSRKIQFIMIRETAGGSRPTGKTNLILSIIKKKYLNPLC